MRGLKNEIKYKVKTLNPYNLVVAYRLARMQEDNLAIMRRAWRTSPTRTQMRN